MTTIVSVAASFVDMLGITVSPICYFWIVLVKWVFKVDDTLDAFGCCDIGGIKSGILTGVFVNPAPSGRKSWLIFAETAQFISQLQLL
jgi:Amt family ammonium transporter